MIAATDLTKHFGSKTAVAGLTFTVKAGEVLGFLGPNGAGKSTTMRMITGFLPPSSGEIHIGGISMLDSPAQAKAKIGYLPESAPLYQDMTVRGFLKFCGQMRGLRGAPLRDAIERSIDTCFLGPVATQAIDTLSKGYRHRTCLAQAILHDPDVLILDEPTDGLDPNQKHEVRQLIARLGKTKAIIFSTHILEEVDAACTRALIVDRGKIVIDGSPAELRAQSPTGSLTDLFRRLTTQDAHAAVAANT
jgi:ABC-2 type transport system ATP-binding protein